MVARAVPQSARRRHAESRKPDLWGVVAGGRWPVLGDGAQPQRQLAIRQHATRTLKLLATMWMTPSSTLPSRCGLPMGESRPGKQDKSISCLGGLCANSLGSESLYCTD